MGEHPRAGEKVWIEARHVGEGKQPNGTVIGLDWHDKEVIVAFIGGDQDSYPMEIFEGMWTDKFEGLWKVYCTDTG